MTIKYSTCVLLTATLLTASTAWAAPGPAQGDTSGPAAGKSTTPSTAVQKNTGNTNSSSVAGAPGMEGKGGAESGSKPAGGNSNGK